MAKKTAAERAAERRLALEKRFAAIYFANGRNGMRAYMAIYPRSGEAAARAHAPAWVAKSSVQAEFKRLSEEAWDKEAMGAKEVLGRMARVARMDIRDFYWQPGELDRNGHATVEGQRKPLSELTDEQAECVKGFKYSNDGRIIQELYDKTAQWANIAKHLKLLNDKLEVSGADGGPIILKWDDSEDAKP